VAGHWLVVAGGRPNKKKNEKEKRKEKNKKKNYIIKK